MTPSPPPQPRDAVELAHPELLAPTAEFLEIADRFGIQLEPGELAVLGRYLSLVLDTTTRINLTAIRAPAQAWIRHVFDSLTLLSLIADLPSGSRVADVGSGAGLPGIPLAIVRPDLSFVLIESTGKKAAFLRAVCERLGLGNAQVVCDRAETIAHERPRHPSSSAEKRGPRAAGARANPSGHREAYDAVLARAVGPLAVVAELTVPLCAQGGVIGLIKGERASEELAASEHALRELRAVHADTVQTPTGTLIVLSKQSLTPRAYPRRPGEPKRRPLGS